MHNCSLGCQHHAIAPVHTNQVRSLWVALILITGFSLVELGAGWFSHSLALIAESGHMLSDGIALGIALLATWIARFPATDEATFGYRRVEILAALANGVGLLAVAGWIGWESLSRLQSPPDEILSGPMLLTAGIGLGVNSLNAYLLHDGSHHNLNLRAVFLHMVADAVSAVGVIVAAIAVWLLHWNWADGAISLGVAGFIALGALPLIRQSLHILLEKAPHHLDLEQIQSHINSFADVESVENLRVWSIALGQEALSAHVIVLTQDGDSRDRLLRQIQTSLQQEFGIHDIFLQLMAPASPPLVSLSQPESLEVLLAKQ